MKNTLQLLSLFLVLALSSCKNTTVNMGNGAYVKGNGIITTESREVKTDFFGVQAQGFVNVYLIKGTSQHIEIVAEENLHEHIITKVKNGVLLLSTEGNIRTSKEIRINVTYKELNTITSSGSTNVYVESELSDNKITLTASGASNIVTSSIYTEHTNIKSSGSANIKINSFVNSKNVNLDGSGASNINTQSIESVNLLLSTSGSSRINIKNTLANKTKATISGASRISLNGNTNTLEAIISGSSNLKAESYISNSANIQASGASTADVFVNEELFAKASGASTIRYTGTPERITEERSGVSNIKMY